MKNILLTGASGFIGRNIAVMLLQAGHTVFAPVRENSISKISNLQKHPQFKLIMGAFYDFAVLDKINSPIDCVLHFASIRGAGISAPENYIKINVEGTQKLLDYAMQRMQHFIFCSSVGVLGTIPKNLPAGCDDSPAPDGIYHQTKYQAEQIVMNTHSDQFKTCAFRLPITYGPYDDGFIPKMIEMIKSKKLFLPVKDIRLHLLSVSALGNLIISMIENNHWAGKVYNVADAHPVYLNDLVNTIAVNISGKGYPSHFKLPNLLFDICIGILSFFSMQQLKTSFELISKTRYYDISNTINELNYKPVDTLTEIKRIL